MCLCLIYPKFVVNLSLSQTMHFFRLPSKNHCKPPVLWFRKNYRKTFGSNGWADTIALMANNNRHCIIADKKDYYRITMKNVPLLKSSANIRSVKVVKFACSLTPFHIWLLTSLEIMGMSNQVKHNIFGDSIFKTANLSNLTFTTDLKLGFQRA